MSGRQFTVFFGFYLKPTGFYLFINALDLVLQNFSIKTINETYSGRKIEVTLFLVMNILNFALLGMAITAMLYYVINRDYRSFIHHTYVWVRFFIVFLLFVVYTIIFVFYIAVGRKDKTLWNKLYFNLAMTIFWIFFEVYNFVWCFSFKKLIIEMTNEDDGSHISLIDPQQKKQLENEQDVFSSDPGSELDSKHTGDQNRAASKRKNKSKSKRSKRKSSKGKEPIITLNVQDIDEPKISDKYNLISKVHESGLKKSKVSKKKMPKKDGNQVESEDFKPSDKQKLQPKKRTRNNTIKGNSDDIIEIVSETINDEESKYEV